MKAINGIMIAENADKAVFYLFKKGQVTDTIDLNMGDVVNLCNVLGKNLAIANRNVRTWKKAAIVMSVATGVLIARNRELKKEVADWKKFQKDLKTVDLFDEEDTENDIQEDKDNEQDIFKCS